jgi:hypothetical protein
MKLLQFFLARGTVFRTVRTRTTESQRSGNHADDEAMVLLLLDGQGVDREASARPTSMRADETYILGRKIMVQAGVVRQNRNRY